jgi:hypothetical protein
MPSMPNLKIKRKHWSQRPLHSLLEIPHSLPPNSLQETQLTINFGRLLPLILRSGITTGLERDELRPVRVRATHLKADDAVRNQLDTHLVFEEVR